MSSSRSAMLSHRMPLSGIKATYASALPTATRCVGDPLGKDTAKIQKYFDFCK